MAVERMIATHNDRYTVLSYPLSSLKRVAKYRSKITVAVAPACYAQRLPRPLPGASVHAPRSALTHARKKSQKKNLRAKLETCMKAQSLFVSEEFVQ